MGEGRAIFEIGCPNLILPFHYSTIDSTSMKFCALRKSKVSQSREEGFKFSHILFQFLLFVLFWR